MYTRIHVRASARDDTLLNSNNFCPLNVIVEEYCIVI